MIDERILSWLINVPATDNNFKYNLEQANEDTILRAMQEKIPANKKAAFERRLKKLRK